MKIAVMGAGAVGCYFGALLARAGHEVVLIGRPALVDKVRRDGLWLESAAYTGAVSLQADTDAAAVGTAQLLLFCVKSGDTQSAGEAIAPHLSNDAFVLSLQNGVDNAQRLSAVLGREAVPAVVYVATAMAGDAHVVHHGRGELLIGASRHSAGIATLLTQAAIPTQVSERVVEALWNKLVVNCAWNALSAISRQPYGRLLESEGVIPLMRQVFDECLAVAGASGIPLGEPLWKAVLDIGMSMPGQHSSTAQDLTRGKRSEIDHLNGHVVRLGEIHGIPTPVNATLHRLVKLLEEERDGR
ncbi:ketopantoate reductase family protein [Hydrocarboniphaga effusa]|uniref:ketopantoate reductase family protein n=1 Tax=Hydrocarboniphaga effusa TaxID=243629 RepID=UPI0035B09B67